VPLGLDFETRDSTIAKSPPAPNPAPAHPDTCPPGRIYSILILALTKRKPAKFSASKAVKANARERVGQPKPARVVDTEPRTGREAKHKPKLDQMIEHEE
jgi:hypothetical protein